MISRDLRMLDLDPGMMERFYAYLDRLRSHKRQLAIWHEDGIVRRSLIGDEVVSSGLVRIEDARRIAESLYRVYEDEVERVLITDFEGRGRLTAGWNVRPFKNEQPYEYLRRRIDSVTAQFDSKLALYPGLNLDRGPLGYLTANRILNALSADKSCALVLAVFDGENPEMILAMKIERGRAVQFTTASHWKGILDDAQMSAEWLAGVSEVVSKSLRAEEYVACCLSSRLMRRLYDSRSKSKVPYGYQKNKDFLVAPDHLVELESSQPAVYIPGIFSYAPFPVTTRSFS